MNTFAIKAKISKTQPRMPRRPWFCCWLTCLPISNSPCPPPKNAQIACESLIHDHLLWILLIDGLVMGELVDRKKRDCLLSEYRDDSPYRNLCYCDSRAINWIKQSIGLIWTYIFEQNLRISIYSRIHKPSKTYPPQLYHFKHSKTILSQQICKY